MRYIGLDIGGTGIKAGLVYKNKIIKKVKVKTGKTKKEVIKNILSVIEQLFDSKVKAIGIGCPGPADYEKGVIWNTPNLPLKGVNLKKIISQKFKRKVFMDNDASCFVLGEAVRLKKKNVVGLTLGTGVGGGIVINGKLYSGKGNAGELGHCTINFDGPTEKLGKGSLEAYLSGKAIKKIYGKEPSQLNKKEWARYGKLLGIGIANLAYAFDPDVVVLGGGISNEFKFFKSSMNREIKTRTTIKTKVLQGNKDGGILGAAKIIK